MTSPNPGLALGIAAVAPTVTALIAILRAVLNTNSRRRKKVLVGRPLHSVRSLCESSVSD
ncbi:hypothetical protein GCM10007061_24920 [Kocuria marina]|nr:hypothetical protein GCM10007061_24920 [Kocuria marina]